MRKSNTEHDNMLLEIGIHENDAFSFTSSFDNAISFAKAEIVTLEETMASVDALKPQCDKIDYILAACSGALCGILDIFLVGKPGESPIGDITDKWFEERTKDFAKICGWDPKKNGDLSSVIRHLEKKFKIPYDQRGLGDAGKAVFDLNLENHHIKSLAHNPTLLGLFFSILDQFAEPNTSHFISDGELISLQDADGSFYLKGNNVPSKLFCAFANWIGHLISDQSGSSGSKGRGMGIPSPFWAWTNDVIAIRRKLNIPAASFDKSMNELAVQIYKEGFDLRFQAAQFLPVLINEVLVRLIYSIRRLIKYFSNSLKEERSIKQLWKACEPFSNPTVKRMLTVAHGTFCLVDVGDATIRAFITGGGTFNAKEFFLRLNIPGIGRFAISLYGEARRGIEVYKVSQEAAFAKRERIIVEDYLCALKRLAESYDDKELLRFTEDFQSSDCYVQAFGKTVILAEKRNVPESKILRTKSDIDDYFTRKES